MPQPGPVRQLRQQRHTLLAATVLAGFALVVFGLLRLQIVEHEKYRKHSEENWVRLEVRRAPRGAIFDRNGELLADNAPSFNIVFRPFPAESAQRAKAVLDPAWGERVSRLLESDSGAVLPAVRAANRSGETAVLRRNAPLPILAAVAESRGELPGIDVQVQPLRRYPEGTLAAHLLGYAGEIDQQELERRAAEDYRPGDLIGRSGIERGYEEILRGRDGREYVVVNAMGQRVATFVEKKPDPPVPGHDLVLTLDLKVQRALEEAMAGVSRGGAVALDPRDGGILGLVSRPAFDPNEFARGLSAARWRELSGGGANPLLNRAIQGLYPPGSTFKIVTMTAALRNGLATPETRLAPCSGHYLFGTRSYGCWKKTGHGSLNLIEALQHSCDVYFYQLGLRVGLPRLEATARAFGLGERTGVDLPEEGKGLIPSVAWYDRHWGAGKWRKGLLLNLAIGQGELLLTPLQLALVVAETASDGHARRPHVVQQVRGVEDFHPARSQRGAVEAPPGTFEALHEALELVVSAGTGTAARVPGLRVAGKTGTAQNPHGRDHALFVCYAPVERPSLVLAFVIENAGHGGSAAAPLAGEVLRRVFLPDSLLRIASRRRVAPVTTAPDTTEATVGD